MSGRSFKIISVSHDDGVNFDKGIYHGSRPGQAALKAFNRYCRNAGLKACKRNFTIEETTRGSKHKKYHYVGTRHHLEKPKPIPNEEHPEYYIEYESTVHKNK